MLKITTTAYIFVLFGLIIIVDPPVPVKILAYSLVYIPSLFASVMLYWFYNSFPESRYTILTTAAKSVVVWHAIFSAAFSFELTVGSIWKTGLEEYMKNNDNINITCINFPSFLAAPTLAFSLSEFQLLRAIFVIYPYQVLTLDYESLSYPIVLSVPILSGIMLLIIYLYKGGICGKWAILTVSSLMKIDVNLDCFIYFDDEMLYHSLIALGAELFIKIWRKRRKLIALMKSVFPTENITNSCPGNPQPNSEPQISNTASEGNSTQNSTSSLWQFASGKDQYKVGAWLAMVQIPTSELVYYILL